MAVGELSSTRGPSLDVVPSSFPPARQRIYTPHDLQVLDLLAAPVWIFDVRRKSMRWANAAAVQLWSAQSLEELLQRDFAQGMSKASETSMNDWLYKFHEGQTNQVTVSSIVHTETYKEDYLYFGLVLGS